MNLKHNKTWYALVNPAAGKGRGARQWSRLERQLIAASVPFVAVITERHGQTPGLAANAWRAGYQHFISVGGDGSHHELVNGLMEARDPSEDPPVVAVLSAGSGNDWARTHGLPHRAEHCISLLRNQHTTSHPAGRITYTRNGAEHVRFFINVAGLALDGYVVETFPEAFKRIPFFPGYLIAGLKQLLFYKAPATVIAAGDSIFRGHYLTIHAGFGRYSGGGMQFVPHADIRKMGLAVTCTAQMPRWRLFANIYRLYSGSLTAHPKVTGLHCRTLHVSGNNIPLEADGEFLGYTPVGISVIPDAFKLVVP